MERSQANDSRQLNLGTIRALSLFATLLTATCSSCYTPDKVPPCTIPPGVTSTTLETGAPPALVQALKDHIGEMAAPGARYDIGDVHGFFSTGLDRRLIFVWHLGNRWIVATEHGGIGYNDPIFAYDLSPDGRTASLMREQIAGPDTVCSTASSMLSLDSRNP